MQGRETGFTKTFKITNFVWIEIFCVKRRNITIKINIWVTFRIKKYIIQSIYFRKQDDSTSELV